MMKMKVAELRSELTKRGLPSNGPKTELVARLLAADEEEPTKRSPAKKAKQEAASVPRKAPLHAPTGYILHPKYRIPDPDDFDAIRQLCGEGGDGYEAVDGKLCCECGELPTENCCEPSCCTNAACTLCTDHAIRKSYGVDPNYWEKFGGEESVEEANLLVQFPDEWCQALTKEDLLSMYLTAYRLDSQEEMCQSLVMGLMPEASFKLGNQIVKQIIRKSGSMHDAGRLHPLLSQTKKIHEIFLSGGANAAFVELMGLLSALDGDRGDCGWTAVQSPTEGDIVVDLSGLMLTALACVTFNMAPELGTAEWIAVRTAVDMMGNFDPMLSDGDDGLCDVMRERLEAHAGILKLRAEGPEGSTQGPPCDDGEEETDHACSPQEFSKALEDFMAVHSSAF